MTFKTWNGNQVKMKMVVTMNSIKARRRSLSFFFLCFFDVCKSEFHSYTYDGVANADEDNRKAEGHDEEIEKYVEADFIGKKQGS